MRLQPGLLQLGNTLLATGLSGQQLFQEVLVAGLVYAGITEFGFYLCVFLVGASQLLLQFVSGLLQRRQALPVLCCCTPLGLGIYLGCAVGLGLCGGGLLLAELRQPAGIAVQVIVVGINLAVGNQPKLISGVTNQCAVVGYQQHGAFKGLQGNGQGVTHFHVEVVGWFVEQQQVGFLPCDKSQRQTRFLATREVLDCLINTVALKGKATQKVAQCLFALIRRQSRQMQQWAGVRVKAVELMLGKVTDSQVLAGLQFATN